MMKEMRPRTENSSTDTKAAIKDANTIKVQSKEGNKKKENKAVNECLTNNGGCDHYCIDTPESFHCECKPGYTLNGKGNFALISTNIGLIHRDAVQKGMYQNRRVIRLFLFVER